MLQQEERVNAMEVEIDRDLSAIIARRQPTARDLRLLIAISKTIANLERVGDEAARIARTVQRLINTGVSSRLRLPVADLGFEADLAIAQLRKALDAFARLDTAQALEVLKQDDQIDQEFDGLMRKLITYMMEDPRTISSSIDLVFVAKAIERVGDHAKNLAEVDHLHRQGHRRAPQLGRRRRDRWCAEDDDEPHPGRRRRIGDRRADRDQPAPCGYEVTMAADAEPGAGARSTACCPTWCVLDWMLPGQSRPGAGRALARRRRARASCRSSC